MFLYVPACKHKTCAPCIDRRRSHTSVPAAAIAHATFKSHRRRRRMAFHIFRI